MAVPEPPILTSATLAVGFVARGEHPDPAPTRPNGQSGASLRSSGSRSPAGAQSSHGGASGADIPAMSGMAAAPIASIGRHADATAVSAREATIATSATKPAMNRVRDLMCERYRRLRSCSTPAPVSGSPRATAQDAPSAVLAESGKPLRRRGDSPSKAIERFNRVASRDYAAIRRHSSAQRRQISAQMRQWSWCAACFSHSSAQRSQITAHIRQTSATFSPPRTITRTAI